MEPDHEWELWVSEEDYQGHDAMDEPPVFFKVQLSEEGQTGGFHIRNRPGEKQRREVSEFYSGRTRRRAFDVQCDARAIVHGTLEPGSGIRATLLVYDFTFNSYRSSRIKNADIWLDFQSKAGLSASGPSVVEVAPNKRYAVMESAQMETWTTGVDGSIGTEAFITVAANVGVQKSTEMTAIYSAEVTGNRPSDDWGNHYQAHWNLQENPSQRNGIVHNLRTCMLLRRANDDEFDCVPYIRVTPNLRTRLTSLGGGRSRDDPITYDPDYEPYIDIEGLGCIDRWNLGAVEFDKLWDCTFHTKFSGAMKDCQD
ncbi:hypothetical protein N8T08_000440 [Aspergillus melleus]|uniref:Uncharacterized protein n=1 Tax=Aspergillus melleus TaxID=138277 RepID=A0ACC3BC23_9EURO|nr:hypothetical protein N8T08_000440 [Aspergillus melleus]